MNGDWRRKAGREGGREAEKGGSEGKGRRVDFRDLKHISIHGEEEATDSRETEGLRAAHHKHTLHVSEHHGVDVEIFTPHHLV